MIMRVLALTYSLLGLCFSIINGYPLINEVSTNPSLLSLELAGLPGSNFDGVLVVIDGNTGSEGNIACILTLQDPFDSMGFGLFVKSECTTAPTYTLVLCKSFNITNTQDIDVNNDGIVDNLSNGFDTIYDAIGIRDTASVSDRVYGSQLGGQDFAFTGATPFFAFRDGVGGAWYAVNSLSTGPILDINGATISSTVFTGNPFTTSFDSMNPHTGAIDYQVQAVNANLREGTFLKTSFEFVVERFGDVTTNATVDYAVEGTGMFPADALDFGGILPSGTISFLSQHFMKELIILVSADLTGEENEEFLVSIYGNFTATAVALDTATGVIQNDDIFVSIAAVGAEKAEGDVGTTNFLFRVWREGDSISNFVVDYQVSGTGTFPADVNDFGGRFPSGQLSFASLQLNTTISIPVSGDLQVEEDEQFRVDLSSPLGDFTIAVGTAIGTIENDDASFSIFATDAVKAEGDTGLTTFFFTVERDGDISGINSVDYQSIDGNARSGSDYFATLGTLSFGPGVEKQLIEVRVFGDTQQEENEFFTVNLVRPTGGGTIKVGSATGIIQNDDDTTAVFSISATDARKAEGNQGVTNFIFTVTRSGDTTGSTSVGYRSIDGTARSTSDYGEVFGTLNFASGETFKTIAVPIVGDGAEESDETFTVEIFTTPGEFDGMIATSTATGTILNDDGWCPATRTAQTVRRRLFGS